MSDEDKEFLFDAVIYLAATVILSSLPRYRWGVETPPGWRPGQRIVGEKGEISPHRIEIGEDARMEEATRQAKKLWGFV